jgi:NAD(P) transhydrogenase
MSAFDYDVLVIGTGPAGEGAAMMATKHGKRVAIIDERPVVGGNCTHMGTIPSKTLRHAVKQIMDYNNNPMFREVSEPKYFKYPNVLDAARRVIDKQVALRAKFYARNRVNVIHGRAEFAGPNSLQIHDENGVETVTAAEIVIATGSRPYQPADVDFEHPRVYNSDSILSMSHTPRSMIIYGAGVIGSEYASIFNGLGVKVDLIDTRDRLLSFLDDEISDALSYHLRDRGVLIRHNEEYERVEADERSVTMHLKSGKRLKADALLWCNGRTGNTDSLALDRVELKANSRGQLEVDQSYRTAVDGIYAVGDVIGWPSLASASYDQGRNVASALLDRPDTKFIDEVPTGIYTIPEISSLGRTEKELTEDKVPYEVGQSFFKDLARAQITGEAVGMLKILFHRDTQEILGIHCFGDQASEIVHIGQAIMKQEGPANNLNYFVNTTFNYPTMAEAYRVAALNGLNRLI